MHVRRGVHGVDTQIAAAGVEEALDVHGLGVGLDGHVLGGLAHLLDVRQELVERVDGLGLLLHEVHVREGHVGSVEEDDDVRVVVERRGREGAGDVGADVGVHS